MLRVDLPKCQAHKVTAPKSPRSLVPYRQSSLCVRAGIVARHALIAQRAHSRDLHRIMHMQHAGQHEQTTLLQQSPRLPHRRT